MNEIKVTEYKEQRVLTTQQLAENYGTEAKVISNNFNRNKERYQEGKHYILLQGEDLKIFKTNHQNDESLLRVNQLYLWTEKGAFLHAKSLNTNVAWEVYDRLVDTYFKIHETKPRCLEDVLIESLREMKAVREKQAAQDAKIESFGSKVDSIREVVALDTTSWRNDTGNILRKIGIELGGGQAYSQVRSESYDLLEKRMGVSLKQRLTNKRRRMADEGICKSVRDKLSYVDIIAEDKKLIEGYMAIVKEMAIKYGIA